MAFNVDTAECNPAITKELDNLLIRDLDLKIDDLTSSELGELVRDFKEEKVYTCKYCGQSYDIGGAVEHTKHCIANYHCHKNCLTCNNYEVHKYMVGNEEEKHDYKKQLVAQLVGSTYSKFYCTKQERYLLDEDYSIEQDREECYTSPEDDVVYKEMPCYKEQWEEITDGLAQDEDNFIDVEAYKAYKETKKQ